MNEEKMIIKEKFAKCIEFNDIEKIILSKIADQIEDTFYECGVGCFEDVLDGVGNKVDDETIEKSILSIIKKFKEESNAS